MSHHAAHFSDDADCMNEERGPTWVGEWRDKDLTGTKDFTVRVSDHARHAFDEARRRWSARQRVSWEILASGRWNFAVAGNRQHDSSGLIRCGNLRTPIRRGDAGIDQ